MNFTFLCLHLGSTNQREHHRFVLAHGHILHQAAPERFVEFRNCLGQLFQFRDKPLEFPPADPWNRIIWNCARYCRIKGRDNAAVAFYDQAFAISQANPECSTVLSYCVSITADQWIHSANKNAEERKKLQKQWKESIKLLENRKTPDSIRQWFGVDNPDAELQAKISYK